MERGCGRDRRRDGDSPACVASHRVTRRFSTWLAPAIALVVFILMFAVSAFVIGPAISGTDSTTPTPIPAPATAPATGPTVDHEGHHPTG